VATPTLQTIKKLFAKSGNRCAFPQCQVHVVEGNTIVADICHICAASPLGPRYDPKQSEAQRYAFDNLILFCANHHRIVDDEPGKFGVGMLVQMKQVHEATATAITPESVERMAMLLVEKSMPEPAAEAPPAPATHSSTPGLNATQKQLILSRAAMIHRDRLARIVGNDGVIADLGGGRLVFHLIPVAALDIPQSTAFAELSRNPNWFPPVAGAARDWKVDFDGLVTGSNADGLIKPQRAYTYVSRAGIVEAVVSSLARGYDSDLIMLPQVQAMLIKYVPIYANALHKAGLSFPAVACASLTGVNKMRLLHDFVGNAFPEDIPGSRLTRDQFTFAESYLKTVPDSIRNAAGQLRNTLDHMANAAGLPTSPYFDPDGSYTLTP
jgi:hypothetical protein